MQIRRLISIILGALLALSTNTPAQSVSINFVPVGNPGNAADPTTGYGAVNYNYDIGEYDVTLSQYCSFLNSVATTSDPYSLYNPALATNQYIAGISRTLTSGTYSYSVIGSSGPDPVTYVSWFDAARFCNWVQNGQLAGLEGIGTTETGAYTLNGAMSGVSISKNANAQYWIPSENEWYKAAYYDPTLNGGTGGYWLYPTRSNTAPGNAVGSGTNEANYNNGVYSVTQSGSLSSTQIYLTPVGAFRNSASADGTYDQGGDVWQWNDAVISGSSRGLRGGSWNVYGPNLRSSIRDSFYPTYEDSDVGFRVAAASVPESTATISLIISLGMLALRWKGAGSLGGRPEYRNRRL